MKKTYTYSTNEELWKFEDILKFCGFEKTEECYWIQIFENGNKIIILERL